MSRTQTFMNEYTYEVWTCDKYIGADWKFSEISDWKFSEICAVMAENAVEALRQANKDHGYNEFHYIQIRNFKKL